MSQRQGAFVISLDFELHWGVRDKRPLESYQANLLGCRRAIPRLLELFQEHGIHATWATVGFLFCQSRQELEEISPSLKPHYPDARLNPYLHLDEAGQDEESDPFHFAPSLIRLIAATPGQEVGTHTFSHYYCLEDGQGPETFRADLESAVEAARRLGIKLQSIVFPRNQFRPDYLKVCAEIGLRAYRGNQPGWLYAPRSDRGDTPVRRASAG